MFRQVVWVLILALGVMSMIVREKGVSYDKLTTQEMKFLYKDPPITHKVEIEVKKIGAKAESTKETKVTKLGKIGVGLFGNTVPYTVNNFIHLANRTYGYGYNNETTFHRVVKNFMVQAGDFQHHDGSGGYSVYNDRGSFKDENFKLKHNKFGRLSMANYGPDTNGAQFFITTLDSCPWLNGHHVVFGQVISGFDTLDKLNNVKTNKKDMPFSDIVISLVKIDVLDPEFSLLFDEADVNNVGYDEYVEEPSFMYTYLLFFALSSSILFFYLKRHYAKQAIIDIRDSDYY